MVEKWMRGGKPMRFGPTRSPMRRPFGNNSAYYGKPSKLFKDSDKDGVPNVFDCKPYNRRRQDVISPFSGASPMNDMWNRQENSRLIKEQQRRLEELRKLEEEKLKELQRLSNVTVLDRTTNRTSFIGVSGKSGETKVFNTKTEAEDYSNPETIKVTTSGPNYVAPKQPTQPTTPPKKDTFIQKLFKNTLLKSPTLGKMLKK